MRLHAAVLLAGFWAALAAPETPLANAEKLLGQRKYAAAEAALKEILSSDPSNARAHGNLALALLGQGKNREAIDEGRLAAAFGPEQAEARYIYGMTLSAGGHLVEASRELEAAVRLKPTQSGPLALLASAYAATGDERTASTYEKLIALVPSEPRIRADFAEYLWRGEKYEQGNRVAAEAIQAFPSNADLALRYGRALAQQDRAADAVVALEAARKLGSTQPATLELLASCYERTDDRNAARVVLEEAVRLNPDDGSLRHGLGRLLLADGRAEEALPHLEKAVDGPTPTAGMELDLGRALESLGRTEAAEAAYRRAIVLSPNLPGAHFALGRLLQREGKKAEAERELDAHHRLYEKGRELVAAADARSAELAYAWAELNHGEASVALARFRSFPETPETLRGRALALSRLGRHPEAASALERALELSPGDHRLELLLVTERSRAAARK